MGCTNCFNGCGDTTSDQCIKYTGNTIPELGITQGDSLLAVENVLTSFLLTIMDGSSIIPTLSVDHICNIVKQYLPDSGVITLNDIVSGLIKSICDIQTEINVINAELLSLNSDYTIPSNPILGPCLTGVTTSSDTHNIVQAVIYKLCSLNIDLYSLTQDLHTNYVLIDEINTYIQDYLNSIHTESLMNSKMVPYSIIPFYPTPAFLAGKFDITGAGLGNWSKIYLCNGQNGTPDKRGRVDVGATNMGLTAFNPAVDPNIPGNPTYNQGTLQGSNTITLSLSQTPNHTHAATVTVTDPGHTHLFNKTNDMTSSSPSATSGIGINSTQSTLPSTTGISVSVVNAAQGGGGAHNNIQPSLGVLYIMYIP